jgi:hypothetical protein
MRGCIGFGIVALVFIAAKESHEPGVDMTQNRRSFDSEMIRRGVDIPIEWRDGAFSVFQELTAMADLLRQPRSAESEPAFIFVMPHPLDSQRIGPN